MACPPRVFEHSSIGSHLKTKGPVRVSKVGWIHGGCVPMMDLWDLVYLLKNVS